MESQVERVLIFPLWKTASYYNIFFKNESPKQPFILIETWSPYIVQNENARNTALFGQVPFSFVALYFDTKMRK